MGAFIENIEPEVRTSLLKVRAKGYNTFQSGFDTLDSQALIFTQDYPEIPEINKQHLEQKLTKYNITLKIEPNALSWKLNQQNDNFNADSITEIWDLIVEWLPNRGEHAPDCQINSAICFRKRYQKIGD